MLFSDSYFTIAEASEGVYKDRGSKFLAFAWPVNSEQEVKEHLLELKKKHTGANHFCYAWRLGADKAAYRANDDGEPSNSAGKPILAQIQANDLTNVLIVVVRYFGGTLLGVRGLINAYKQAALEALQEAEIVEHFILFEYKIEFDFDALSAVMRLLKEYEAKILSTTYETNNVITFRVKKADSEKLEGKVKELYTTKLKFLSLA